MRRGECLFSNKHAERLFHAGWRALKGARAGGLAGACGAGYRAPKERIPATRVSAEGYDDSRVSTRERIRVRLKSNDYRILDQSAGFVVEAARRVGATVAGPILLPPVKSRYRILRSQHLDEKPNAKAQARIHRRLVDILGPSQETIDALLKLDLPEGVGVEVKTLSRSEIRSTIKSMAERSDHGAAEVELIEKALTIIGSPDALARWMQTPIPALSGQSPYSLLGSVQGREQVETVLGRIQHGIF